jgi:pyruvate formate lyase activating enzyme
MMRIGGLTHFSLSDFPGRIAAIVFTQGCNFRCPFCHNGGLIELCPAQRLLDPESEVHGFLASRKRRLDGVVVSGGEPTIQPSLPSFLRRLKDMGFEVKLDTNGSRPVVLSDLLRADLVDFISMDVKAPFQKYDLLSGVRAPVGRIRESIDAIATSGIAHEFRTTFVPGMLTASDLAEIQLMLPAGSPHTTQVFRPEHALDPGLRDTLQTRAASSSI